MEHKVPVSVFVTVVLVALGIGFLSGYFVHGQMFIQEWKTFQSEWRKVYGLYEDHFDRQETRRWAGTDTGVRTSPRRSKQGIVRRDILYHKPSSTDAWGSLTSVGEGEGTIEGTIKLGSGPVGNLKFALFLDSGRRTPVVSPDNDGDYQISLKSDTYYFHGIAIYNQPKDVRQFIFVNKVAKNTGYRSAGDLDRDADTRMEQFEELAKQYGPRGAAKRLARESDSIIKQQNLFQFKLGSGETIEFPTFRYPKPVQVVAPRDGYNVSRGNLKFIWKPYSNASRYSLLVSRIRRKGRSTSYYPVIKWEDITVNAVAQDEVLEHRVNHSFDSFDSEGSTGDAPFQSGQSYTDQVIAYGEDGRVLSATSVNIHDGVQFSIK